MGIHVLDRLGSDERRATTKLVAEFVPTRNLINSLQTAGEAAGKNDFQKEGKATREAYSSLRWLLRASYWLDRELSRVERDLEMLKELSLPEALNTENNQLHQDIKERRQLLDTFVSRYGGGTKLKGDLQELQTEEDVELKLLKDSQKNKRVQKQLEELHAKVKGDIQKVRADGQEIVTWVSSTLAVLRKVEAFRKKLAALAA